MALADLVPGKAEDFARKHKIEGARCYNSGHELLGRARVDVYAVADDSLLFGISVSWQEVGGHG